LVFKGELSSIVKEATLIRDIIKGRGIAFRGLPIDANREACLVDREALCGDMTHGAGHSVIRRQTTIKKETTTQGNLFKRLGIIRGNRERCGKAEGKVRSWRLGTGS
jgi:hypothetical protein